MAYKVIILYQLYMPSYFLGTFTEYPYIQLSLASDDSIVRCQEDFLYTYTGVGLSTLLVSTYRAMRRPIDRGTSDRMALRFFSYVSAATIIHKP